MNPTIERFLVHLKFCPMNHQEIDQMPYCDAAILFAMMAEHGPQNA